MRSTILFGVLFTLMSCPVLMADDVAEKSAVNRSVNKSIKWLEADMQAWRNEHQCSACHHGPMYLWSMNVARRQGYTVEEKQLREMTEWLLTNDEARLFPKMTDSNQTPLQAADRMTSAMMGHNNLSQPTLFLAHALNAMPDDQPLKKIGSKKVIEHLASAQKQDGSFEGRNGWRPIFNTPQILTRFAETGLQSATTSSAKDPTDKERLQILKGLQAYLAQQPVDETHQGLVLRTLSASQSASGGLDRRSELSTLVNRLMTLQRRDGGWSQTDDRDSDAFATGQSLYVLQRAGVPSTDAAIHRGLTFLVQTQRDDGTWPMTSRPNPETGKPAELLNPITYAATAWATLGLASYAPQTSR